MPCEDCGTFIGCGPAGVDACSPFADPDEDKCHKVTVLVKDVGGTCKARLWLQSSVPSGWTAVGHFWIRIQAGKVSDKCIAKLFFENECDGSDVADYSDPAMA